MNNYIPEERSGNLFDNLIVDINELYKDHPLVKEDGSGPHCVPFVHSLIHRLYRNPVIPLRYRRYAYHALRRINVDLSWFDEFKEYWSTVLNGRPLWHVQDLFFLKNWYRVKFQNNQVVDTENADVHLEAWQSPEILYQLLHLVCRESVSDQTGILQQLKRLGCNIQSGTFLEFGCATAPITASLFEFWKVGNSLKMYICDMQTLAFHYAAYRFRRCTNVIPILLRPEDELLLRINDELDAIFCVTVFEHLNKPLDTVKIFHDRLKQGGYVIFDYIKSGADGLDTEHGVRQRNGVMDFIAKNFELVYGCISKETSMGLTIVKKK